MSHVRCIAHSLVTAVAIVSWGGAVYVGGWHGAADDPLRFLGLTLLSLAAATTVLALLPVVFFAFLKRYTDFLDSMTALEAVWNFGFSCGARQEKRKREVLYEQHPSLSVVGRD